jgi:hypothetical protein
MIDRAKLLEGKVRATRIDNFNTPKGEFVQLEREKSGCVENLLAGLYEAFPLVTADVWP